MRITSNLIYRERSARHWTQAELAGKLGVHINAVANWEGGFNSPNVANERALRDLFSIKEIAPASRLDKIEAALLRIENLLREQYGKNI